jgi:type II secretory pathway component GspD/PulD (secretin)
MTATAASSHTASSTSSQQNNDDVTVLGGSGGSSSEKDSAKDKTNSLVLEVTELNSRNFDSLVSDGNVWLVEFYTPW